MISTFYCLLSIFTFAFWFHEVGFESLETKNDLVRIIILFYEFENLYLYKLTFKILGTQSQYFTLLYIRNRFYRIQLPLNTWERCISRLLLPPLSFETFPLKDLKKSLTNIIKERKYITRLVPLHESGRSSSSFMNICVNNQGTQVNTLRCLM